MNIAGTDHPTNAVLNLLGIRKATVPQIRQSVRLIIALDVTWTPDVKEERERERGGAYTEREREGGE